MAEDGASTNGHVPPERRRKHIYPPLEQMAAEQAASAQRRFATETRSATATASAVPEATPPPAPPTMAPLGSPEANGHRPARKRKHIYPPVEHMTAARTASEPVASTASTPAVTPAKRKRKHIYPPVPRASAATESAAEPVSAMAVAEPVESALATIDDDQLEGETVELRMSAVGMVDAGDVQFSQGALGAARADNVSVEQGALGAALATNVDVSRGYARSIVARQVQLDRAAARVIVAADVKAERSAVMFLIARKVTGDVKVLVDWRGALAFGAVAGVVMGILRGRRGK